MKHMSEFRPIIMMVAEKWIVKPTQCCISDKCVQTLRPFSDVNKSIKEN